MTREEIFNKLLQIFKVAMKNHDGVNITEESHVRYDLGINSVGLIYLVIGIEEEFDIDMSCTSFSSFNTVKDVIDFIEKETN